MKRLVKNIGIFAIGNLGSKVIGFLLIAIFTRYLTTTQVDCKINPNAVQTKKPAFLKMVFTTNPFFRS